MAFSSCFFSFIGLVLCLSSFHLTVLAHFTSSVQTLCHDDELSSLLLFKESLNINKSASFEPSAYPKVASWKASKDCCSWDGVSCNEVTGHLIGLDLSSSWLYGNINASSTLFQLVHLEWLSLADNDFNGSKIPSEIINLSRLSYLNLSYSAFSGQIPSEVLELSKLETLDASCNSNMKLQKPGLRSLVEQLTQLKVLYLGGVNIFSSVPDTLANLSSLTVLSLRDCHLQGKFPAMIFQLPNLRILSVWLNPDLYGSLPEFEKNKPLEVLRIGSTRFSSEIPYSIGNLNSLQILDISDCSFSGSLPPSLGNLTSLEVLDLSFNNFSGELPSVMGNLSSLEELNLSFNNFSSQHSRSLSWMANYSKLTHLCLSKINLVGEIPSWLMSLTHLTLLYMGGNQLNGTIPSQIRNQTKLKFLALNSNQLQGQFPSALYDLENLQELRLGFNNLSGIIDINMLFYKLYSLEELDLSSNNLSLLTKTNVHTEFQKLLSLELQSCNLIEFPNFLKNQDELEILDLSSNKIASRIPRWFLNSTMYSLLFLNLSNNLLTGFDQPPVFFSWTRLINLDLTSNKLQGSLPVPPLSTAVYLVSYNSFTGEIPPSLCNLNKLEGLDLSHNNLSGKLPQCLGNISPPLLVLNLQNNKFHGTIPQNFVNGTNLKMIDLSQNQLQGRIPRSLVSCTKLEFLDLGKNQISDTFPSWMGTLPRLKVLILQSNRLRGAIKEPELDNVFPELHIIDLSYNRFTGNIPSKYFKSWHAMSVVNASPLAYMGIGQFQTMKLNGGSFQSGKVYDYSLQMSTKGIELEYGKISNFLTAIIFSGNKFEGEIPASIANLRRLHSLNLSNNNLKGLIPPSMGNLSTLESLDLSNNKLSGQLPQQLEDLTFLSYLNVSNNNLIGRIPRGKQFDTFGNTSFEGNPGLCGKQIAKQCEDTQASKKEEDRARSKFPFEFGWKIILIGYGGGLIAGVALEHAYSARKQEWFMMISERKLMKTIQRNRI